MTNIRKRSSGFSLIELMVVVGILGIVFSIAAPAMRDLLANQRMKSAAFDLIVASMVARSEAIKRGISIYIAAPSGNLTSGWCLQVAPTTVCNPSLPDAQVTLGVHSASSGVTYSFSTGAAPVTFNRSGRLTNEVKVNIQDNELASLRRCVTIDIGGNAKSVVGSC